VPVPRVNLFESEIPPLSEFLDAPWAGIAIRDVAASTSARFTADAVEHALYVMHGDCIATSPETGAIRVAAGGAIALPLGGYVELLAGPTGLRVLHISMGLAG
jgi:hypothetical protein